MFATGCTAVHQPLYYSLGVSCGSLNAPTNGHVNTTGGTSFEDVAMYSCDEGYMLNGTVVRTCQADGQWNGSEPTCESEISEFNYQLCICVHVTACR